MEYIKNAVLKFKKECMCSLFIFFALFFSVFCVNEGFNVYGGDHSDSETNQSMTSQDKDKGNKKDKFFQKEEKSDKGGSPPEYKKGELLVKFKDEVSESEANSIHKGVGSSVKRTYKKTKVQLVQLPEGKDMQEAIDDYKKTAKVKYAEPNYRMSIDSTIPNDPRFSELWGLHNTGQTGGAANADVDAPEAWDLLKGNSGVVVGVIDTGVDYIHGDLQANIWVNPFEAPWDGIDNDGNGFIDDLHGINAIMLSGDPMDDHGHGTHVSGTIGAAGNNGEGVVGVNWQVKIMGLKFLSSNGSGWTSDAVTCIEYVIDMRDKGVNIKVTNNSWGGGGYSNALYDAINELRSRGILFVAAAGNAGTNNDVTPRYPASYNLDNIIAVAATDHNDGLAWFSCYGATSVDLGAPGVSILSTTPSSENCNSVCNSTLFFDDMESGGGNWTTGGTNSAWAITNEQSSSPGNAWSDSPYAYYQNYTDSYFMLAGDLNLSGVADQVAISFNAKYDLETGYDYLYVEVSGNGGVTWQVIGTLNGSSGWKPFSFVVPSNVKTSQFRCRFRLITDYSVVRDGVYIDDVSIQSMDTICETVNNYDWYSGTSMATPHVAGAAALVWGYSPAANYLDVTGILLTTVDPLASLYGKTVSGGRLNLRNALQQVNPFAYPIAHYAFEEGSGTVAGDSSGNGNNGIINGGATWTTGKVGGGLGFDGVNDYVAIPLINNDEVSAGAWFYKNANDTTRNDAIFSGFRNNANLQLREGFELRFPSSNPNTIEFVLVTQDGSGNRTTRTARKNLLNSVGIWYHAMGTYDKTTGQQRLYINGQLVHTVIHPAGNTAVPLTYYSDMRIGHSRVNVGYFNGVIDDVRLYNQPLSDQEIRTLYNAFSGDIQAHYTLDEESGAIANDISGNGNHGAVNGGATWTTGQSGGGLEFDGLDDYVTIPRINNDEVSVCTWFYKNANDTTRNDAIFSGFRNNSNVQLREGFELRFPSGNPNTIQFVLVTQDGGGAKIMRTARLNLGNSVGGWYHVVGTYNKTTGEQRLYVNGASVDTQTHSAGNTVAPLTAYLDMRIGYSRVNAGYFNGILDDVRLYKRALTEQEVQDIYNNGL